MGVTPSVLALVTLVGLLLGLLGGLVALRGFLDGRAEDLARRWEEERVAERTGQSLARSRAVLRGNIAEHLAPMFDTSTFPDPGDARFLGRPVDFIVFDGYGEVRAGRAACLREVVFVDVKTGASRLSPVERSIRDCVEAGRVRTVVVDLAIDGIDTAADGIP